MDWTCLIIDLADDGFADTWQEKVEGHDYPINLSFATPDQAQPMMETGSVVMMFIYCPDSGKSREVCRLLQLYKTKIGPLAHFQGIICSEPSPTFLTEVFEYGIENMIAEDVWPEAISQQCQEAYEILQDEDSSENKTLTLFRNILDGDQGGIAAAEAALGDAHEFDPLAAFAKGSALQAIGKFDEAIEAFGNSRRMNKNFRQAASKMGENLLVLGRTDEAINVLNKLEKMNPRDVDRKASLATAWVDKGDMEKAKKYLSEANKLDPGNPRINEAKAHIYLASGKVGAAFKMMDQLEEVGPFFAAKLNEMGIRLSQAGKGKSALALYQKAHKIVKKELRYKISLNAALATYRLKDYQLAIKYLARTEKEYGRPLAKVEKIRKACKAAIAKKAKAKKAG